MKNARIFLFIIALVAITACHSGVKDFYIDTIQCNHKNSPSGVEYPLSFSWKMKAVIRNQYQTAYRLLIADNKELLKKDEGNIYDSGKLFDNQSIGVSPAGLKLQPATRYFWKVKVWGNDDLEADWSETSFFITGLFSRDDWDNAQWISYETMDDSAIFVPGVEPWNRKQKDLAQRRPVVPYFRKDFHASKKIESAFLFISGLGQYKASINGQTIGDDFLSPGWTHYQKTCLYNTYDVTSLVKRGENVLGVMVGNGFYNINKERYSKVLITYGMPKMIGKLKITYSDGSTQIIVSDQSWKASPSPLTFSSIYGGEAYNAQLEQEGWNRPGFDDSKWQDALLAKDPEGKLKAEFAFPVKVQETFNPVETVKLGVDTFIYDFGQNASGIFSLKVKGNKGDTIRLWPGELIFNDKHINQLATGRPHYYEYILKGEGEETFQPQFSYYGFRYIQVDGAHPVNQKSEINSPQILELKALHTFNSAPETGAFECSNPMFNNIDKLIRYAIQSNFQSVLTDCPHREKLGWLEQTYLMGNSIQFNYDLYNLYHKIVDDMIDSQRDNGLVGAIAPEYVVFGGDFTDTPEWGSAIVFVPWLVYKWYGDKTILEEAWPAMVKYVHYLDTKANGNILSYGLGDWYDLGPKHPGYVQLSPKASTATALYYYDYFLLTKIGLELGKVHQAEEFANKAEEIRNAYNNLLFDPKNKIYATGSQSAMAIPLSMGIVEDRYRQQVTKNLVDSILADNKAVTAGDIGFHYLIDALTKAGESQLIYDMNNRDDVPGYGYQIKKGATALTESWQALPDVSNNHLMLGHLMEWFYTGLGGIGQQKNTVAYSDIVIKPSFVDGLDWVKTSYECSYGTIKSEWKKTDQGIEMNISVPVNTTASIYLPQADENKISESGISLKDVKGMAKVTGTNRTIVVTGSGDYQFLIRK